MQAVVDQSVGPYGSLIFVATYSTATLFLVPASVLTLGAGAVYGPVYGTALVSLASTLGSILAFLTARYVARPIVEQKLQGSSLFQNLERRVLQRGAQLVLLLRLTPLVPFAPLNYMCGELRHLSSPLILFLIAFRSPFGSRWTTSIADGHLQCGQVGQHAAQPTEGRREAAYQQWPSCYSERPSAQIGKVLLCGRILHRMLGPCVYVWAGRLGQLWMPDQHSDAPTKPADFHHFHAFPLRAQPNRPCAAQQRGAMSWLLGWWPRYINA